MISAFVNCFKIPELRDRILFTLLLLFVARVGAQIPLPGFDPRPLVDFFAEQQRQGGAAASLLGLYNMFTGGALLKGAVFALGVMPYISASIIFQLMAAVVPALARLQQEGDVGRQKLTQYTRYATLGICLIQGTLLTLALLNPGNLFPGFDGRVLLLTDWYYLAYIILILTTGSILLMWLGEQITVGGIGNGVSLLITVGIVAELPSAVTLLGNLFRYVPGSGAQLNFAHALLMVAMLLGVTAGIVAVTQATRKIPVQYARRQMGNKVVGGQNTFLPLKVNYSGVMPVIFASAILLFGQQIFTWLGSIIGWEPIRSLGAALQHGAGAYYFFFALFIFVFSYFWVSVMFKPVQIADDLKKYGGYVPGVRPGEPTAKFLDFVMTRLTLAGAVFLTLIAVVPDILYSTLRVPYQAAQFFGGTGMLITVGVLLDTLRQVETYLLQRHYDGFLQKGRIKGRSVGRTRAPALDAGMLSQYRTPAIAFATLFLLGFIAFAIMLVMDAQAAGQVAAGTGGAG